VNSRSPRTPSTDPDHLSVRSDWLARVVDGCQTFVDLTTPSDPSVLTRRLQEFVQSLPRAQSLPEKLVLRGRLLEVYVQLETRLGRLGVATAGSMMATGFRGPS
jgi:hypothetical protein